MNILFRADGLKQIGTGHIMRCLALAEYLAGQQAEIYFMIKDLDSLLIEKLADRKINVILLDKNEPLEEELQLLEQKIREFKINFVIIDSYTVDAEFINGLKQQMVKVLCIDDLADRLLPADILLNQNNNATPELYMNKVTQTTKLLLGPKYALLRNEFRSQTQKPYDSRKIETILVTMGGADNHNQTIKILRALAQVSDRLRNLKVIVVIGASYSYENELKKTIEEQCNYQVEIRKNAANMAELINNSDLVISAAGSTSWELCFLGLPGIVMTIADNQRPIAKKLGQDGIFVDLGWFADVTEENIAEAVSNLCQDIPRLKEMSRKGQCLVDGQGVVRVGQEVLSYARNN